MLTRRQFLKVGAGAATGMVILPLKMHADAGSALANFHVGSPAAQSLPGGTLDPTSIAKFTQSLVIPPPMPATKSPGIPDNVDYYEIAVRQFTQQILPAPLPQTTVWGYGSANHAGTFNYPAFTIEARFRKPVRVKWINDLKDANGNYLPHLLPVDQTLHWANPPGGKEGRDTRPEFETTPGSYTGPVPMVPHLHGGHTSEQSDGYPEAWFLPAAGNIPAGYATEGTFYEEFKAKAEQETGMQWQPGTAVFQYDNDQRAATLWYHDHTLGMTRVNVYAGPAGFYLLRGGVDEYVEPLLPGPAPSASDKPGKKYFEIPIAIQDRCFNADGSLFYPNSREFFDGFPGPYMPEDDSDISPIWNPEFFGNTMVVNGRAWPRLEVEQRRYRFRFLNGCDSRFLILRMSNGTAFWQIGAEGGYLPQPVQLSQLLMAPAERADVIVDFTSVPVGTEIILQNLGPDEPFGGGTPGVDFEPADPATTGQVMQFRVVAATGLDTSMPIDKLKTLPVKPAQFSPTSVTRKLSLNEMMSMTTGFDGPAAALLGTIEMVDGVPVGIHQMWMDGITENPALNSTEIWEIYNFTEDAHPIHVHQVQFGVVNRQPFDPGSTWVGTPRPPEVWETGLKDTVIAYPDEITRVVAQFERPGLYVWHCHIIEHEDNEMMRPFYVGSMPKSMATAKRGVRPKWWRKPKKTQP